MLCDSNMYNIFIKVELVVQFNLTCFFMASFRIILASNAHLNKSKTMTADTNNLNQANLSVTCQLIPT